MDYARVSAADTEATTTRLATKVADDRISMAKSVPRPPVLQQRGGLKRGDAMGALLLTCACIYGAQGGGDFVRTLIAAGTGGD